MKKITEWLNQVFVVCRQEFRGIIRDAGVIVIMVAAPLLYPLLYNSIYYNETLYDVPVAVVDNSGTAASRQLIRSLDASPDIAVKARTLNMDEAKKLFSAGKVHGIIYIPSDFSKKLADMEQAFISVYSDMSSFVYYRAILMSTNYATLEMGRQIQIERLGMTGVTGESATLNTAPIPYERTVLFNPDAGFSSFLMTPAMILIIYQTLLFGISMRGGQWREDGTLRTLLPVGSSAGRIVGVVSGKALCFLAIYSVLSAWVVGIVPSLFGIPHLGDAMTLITFMLPFLLATIFFGMTIASFMPDRETGIVSMLCFSMVLLFMSGFSWPQSNMGGFWSAFSEIFPSTQGMRGYIRINGMGASLSQVSTEYAILWIQAAVYFTTACLALKPRRRKA